MSNLSALIVDNPLVAQLLEELADVGADLGGISIAELRLQFSDDLAEGALAVATLQYLPTCALQFDCAFGEQDHAFFAAGLVLCSPAATGGKAGLAGILGRGHVSVVPLSATRPKRKQVPRLRIAIDEANRNAPLGMTDFLASR